LFLQVLHRPQVHGWLVEHQVDLGSSDAEATHALIVEGDCLRAWVAPMALARRIVRAQSLAACGADDDSPPEGDGQRA
jgi:hypothetical protein